MQENINKSSNFDRIVTISLYILFVGSFLWLVGIVGYIIYFQQERIARLNETNTSKPPVVAAINYEKQKQETTQSVKTAVLPANISSKHERINKIIKAYAEKSDGEISIVFKNLTNNERVYVNEKKDYYMASLYKVILVLYLLEEIKNDKLSLTDRVGSSSATIEFAMDKIITESNNEYAQTLARSYGWAKIQDSITEKLGISFNFKDSLTISSINVEKLFESIAYSLKIDTWESEYILKLLNAQKRTHKLPKYLPKNIYSHNKTGEYEGYSHDAGIFYTPRGNYILIVMTKSKNPENMNEHMAKLSKEIFDTINSE